MKNSVNNDIIVRPYYTKTTSEVYLDFAVNYLNDIQNLRLLSAVYHGSWAEAQSEQGSWIPKWNHHRCPAQLGLPLRYYDASVGAEPFSAIRIREREIWLDGLVFVRVSTGLFLFCFENFAFPLHKSESALKYHP